MPIKPPSFNYGGGGGNLMSAAIGAALSKNRGPSFGQQVYMRNKQFDFLDQQRELAAITSWALGRDAAQMEGKFLTPEAIASDPTFAGQNIPIHTSSLLGLMPGLTEKDLENYNLTREQVSVRYGDQAAVHRARGLYNPLAIRFEQGGPIDPADLTPEDSAYLSQNPDIRDRMVRVDQQYITASLRYANAMDLPDFATEIETAAEDGLSFSELKAIRGRMQDEAAVRTEGRQVDQAARAESELRLNQDMSYRQQQQLEMNQETHAEGLTDAEISDINTWMTLYSNDTDIGAWALAHSGNPPPPDVSLTRPEAQDMVEIERQMTEAEGVPDIYEIVSGIVKDPVDVGRFMKLYTHFTPMNRRIGGGGGGTSGYRGSSGGSTWKPANDNWAESVVKLGDLRSNDRTQAIRNISDGFIADNNAWELLRIAFPHRDLPETAPSDGSLDQLLWDLIVEEGNQGGVGLIIDIYNTDTPHTAREIISRAMNGIMNDVTGTVPSPDQLMAYRAVRAAQADEVMSSPNWDQLIQASMEYHMGIQVRGNDPASGAAYIESARDGIGSIVEEGRASGETYDLVGPEGESAGTKSKSFQDERIEELARPTDGSSPIMNMWAGDQVRNMDTVTFTDIEGFEVARLWKSWHGDKGKQDKYEQILTTIVNSKYDDGDLPGLIDQLMALTDRGDYAADEKYRFIFSMVKEWITRPGKRDNIDGWDSRWMQPLSIALYMIQNDTPNPTGVADRVQRNKEIAYEALEDFRTGVGMESQ